MKNFILGFIVALILGAWVTLAITGVISLKVAILVPLCLVVGGALGILIADFWRLYINKVKIAREVK